MNEEKIAILVPCFNEELTIARVVKGFLAALPGAEVYVFENASTDQTARIAAEAGAQVTFSPVPGKGNAVRHMFDVVEADWYIMVDGDATYPPEAAPGLLAAARERRVDMVVGRRMTPDDELRAAYRPLHQFGNRLVSGLIRKTFGSPIHDVFSGYRVFSRTFVKTVPLHSTGFQIEVEMTLQALSKGYSVEETGVAYHSRPEGSVSKLNTYRDGLLVLASFVAICKDYRPALFVGALAGLLGLLSLAAGLAPVVDYICDQWVYHVPLAILATGLAVLAALSLCIGVILQTQLVYHNEMHRLVRQGFRR